MRKLICSLLLIVVVVLPSVLVESSNEYVRENATSFENLSAVTYTEDLGGKCSGECELDELGVSDDILQQIEEMDANRMTLRALCRDEENIVLQWTPAPEAELPMSYAVEQAETLENNTKWNVLAKTNETQLHIGHLNPDSDYQFRVRLFSNGAQVGMISDRASTQQVGYTPGVVSNVRVEQKLMSTTEQIAIVRWDPTPDHSCRYEVDITWKTAQRAKQRNFWADYSGNLFEYILESLEFGANYTVNIRGTNYNRSTYNSGPDGVVVFSTLSTESTCLQFTNYDLNICPPEIPVGLTVNELQRGDKHVNGTLQDVVVDWTPSSHPPLVYITEFRTWINGTLIYNDFRNVTGNMTSVTFPSALVGVTFEVIVGACSLGGCSRNASIDRILDTPKPEPQQTPGNFNVIFLISMAFLAVGLVAAVAFLAYHQYMKKKRYERRCQYFESLDQKPSMVAMSLRSKLTLTTVNDKWEIPSDSLLQGDILGQGAFGVVRKGLLQSNVRDEQPLLEVAVKMVKEDASLDELRQLLQEIELMKSVGQHPHIVSIIGCCTASPRMMLVTEYCALGDLQRYLRKEWDRLCSGKLESRASVQVRKSAELVKYAQLALATEGSSAESSLGDVATPVKPTLFVNQMYDMDEAGDRYLNKGGLLTSNDLLSFARQITVGMEFLASNRVVHRDLAARNVLVCADRTVKISDFGLSRDIYEQNFYRKKCTGKFPIKWMAIESLLHQVYTTQSDVWSFGILLWEIVTLGGNPYPSTQTDCVFKLLRAGYRMECPGNCSAELYTIMLSCWQAKPRDRPTFSQLHARLDELLEGSIQDQYLNLDLMMLNESPDTSTSTVGQRSSSASTQEP